MGFSVDFTPQALEDIRRLDRVVAERVVRKVDWLAKNFELISPQPPRGKFQGLYKLVLGDWRVVYSADFAGKTLLVHLVRHRREIYR